MGSRGFRLAADLCYGRDEWILDIGVGVRSTPFLAGVAPTIGVDIDRDACERAKQASRHGPHRLDLHVGDAEEILPTLDCAIRFAWLDGYDYPYPDYAPAEQREMYEARGQEYSPEASRAAHLTLAKLVAPLVCSAGYVAFDDTWFDLNTETYEGKGGDAVPHLVGEGWEVTDATRVDEIVHDGFVAMVKP